MSHPHRHLERVFAWMLAHRWLSLVGLLLVCGFFVTQALKVRADHSPEHLFPVWSPARALYDEMKQKFPHEDTRALVLIEAADLWTQAGLRRVHRLEEELRRTWGVAAVDGPFSVKNVVAEDGAIRTEPLLPSPDLSSDELASRRELATQSPLYLWNVTTPEGTAFSIRVTLDPSIAHDDEGRQRFLTVMDELLERHQAPGQALVFSGIPALRAQFAQMIAGDVARLLPLALVVVLALLYVTFRSLSGVLAGLLTVLTSLLWTYGVIGLLGFPLTILSGLVPIIVVIISMSDTVHVVSDFTELRRQGTPVPQALVQTMAHSAIPCLTTEVVLAMGFLTLVLINIMAVVQVGLSVAIGMLVTWLANMTVLPLVLSLVARRVTHRERPFAVRAFRRLVAIITFAITYRARLVVLVFALLLALAAAMAPRVKRLSFVFDDLRPDSKVAKDIRTAERLHGGIVPLVVYIEVDSKEDNAALDPEAVQLADRTAQFLRKQPELRQANSIADWLRRVHPLFADDASAELPPSKALAAQELALIDDGRLVSEFVSFDRRTLVTLAMVQDVGSQKAERFFTELDAFVLAEQKRLDARPSGPRIRLRTTGEFENFRETNRILLEGLFLSFSGSLVVSFLVMCVLFRSWRLGLVGLVPNLAPLLLIFAWMTLLGVHLKPATVLLFSITLVIAEDDTIQYLSRFRARYLEAVRLGSKHPDRDAALQCLGDVGLPMFITTTSVTAGFLLLLDSSFLGIAHLGVLIGSTLFAAVFADLFLTPILLVRFRPLRKLAPPVVPSAPRSAP